jgi:hypothetical protein
MNSQAGRSVRARSWLRVHFCDIALVMETEPEERSRRGPSRRQLDELMTLFARSDRHNLPSSRQ